MSVTHLLLLSGGSGKRLWPLSNFSAQSTVIQSSVSPAGSALAAREDGFYTLADFEYEDLSLAGAFHQQANLSIRQPDGLLGGPAHILKCISGIPMPSSAILPF